MNKMFEEHTTPNFTLENLVSTLQGLAENQGEIFTQAVVECFEWFRPRSWNPTHKSNSPYQINQKIISENTVEIWGNRFHMGYYREEKFMELDKVFHGLDGKGLPKRPHDALTAIKDAMQKGYSEAETNYFRFKWFKVGTLHIWFKREDLLKEFNRIGSDARSNLPG